MTIKNCIKVGVLGASGYIGLELLQRLATHPDVELAFISSESLAGEMPFHIFPPLRRHDLFKKLTFSKLENLVETDLIISALPTGVLPASLPFVLKKTKKIINISGDFRLDNPENIRKYYPATSLQSNNITSKQYFVPGLEHDFSATIINISGCMASAAIYAAYPLIKNNLLQSEIIIDAKTGSSGAGAKNGDSHAIRANNVKPHKLLGHRHGFEVKQYLKKYQSSLENVHMTTTSLDISRGVIVHVHGNLTRNITMAELEKIYRTTYKNTDYIRIVMGKKGNERLPSIKNVIGTNDCEIAIAVSDNEQHVVAVATLDNLVKGGAGNAIQAMNEMYQFNATHGLKSYGVWP